MSTVHLITTDNQRGKNVKVLVCQRGARRRYAVPRLLEEAGMLAALYTDSCVYSPVAHIGKFLCLENKVDRAHALISRNPHGIPKEKIFSSDAPLYSSLFRGLFSADLSSVYKRRGLKGASVVYSMYGEESTFLKWAKSHGAKVIVDVFIHPGTNRIVADEEFHFLGTPVPDSYELEDAHSRNVFALADLLLCPSEWVANGVRDFSPEYAHKIRIVPYGSSLTIAEQINKPQPGRILFAGREPLRKGLQYLAKAAELLRREGLEIDVRVAGVSNGEILWMENRGELNCLGRIPMEQMEEEYAQASAFVLPSLSEGQAGVLLEAMARGCAVVATKESGVDLWPGCGVTVPVGDAKALATEIKKIMTNDVYRNDLAKGALRQAAGFSVDAWKLRLVDIVKEAADLGHESGAQS